MSDAVDVDSLTAAAAEAASHNDPVAAEALLRLALDLQLAASGPDHPDLASTLNNLALMLERQGNKVEAERCYRRAYDIARRGAPADDEIVTVSRENLLAFLQSIGVANPVIDDEPVTRAPAMAAAAAAPAPRTEPSPAAARAVPPTVASAPLRVPAPASRPQAKRPVRPAATPPQPATPAASARSGRGLMWLVVIGVAGAVAAWLVLARSQTTQSPPANEDPQPSANAAAPPASPPAAPPPADSATPPAAAPERSPSTAAVDRAPSPAVRDSSSTASASGAATSAVSADGRLCTSLSRSAGEWRCDAAGDNVGADAVYYYTRVRTPRDAVVRHRWSYQGEVVRTVNLQVRANAEPGFRTFSRQIVTNHEPGPWEVALLAPDGEVIDRQRFSTR